ncbi:MAG: hypothetical protein QM763_02865 [Agriterribacter sp.]
MKRKKWWLIIVPAIGIAVYFFLFFKTYNEEQVSADADHIISIDTKRITNTVIWTYITTPKLWKPGKIFSLSDEVDWKDMVKIPDYIFVFHVKDQPLNAWYAVLEVKDETDFAKGLRRYGFVKAAGTERYISSQTGLELIVYKKKILVGNAGIADKSMIAAVAEKILVQGQHIQRARLQQNVDIPNHIAWIFSGNDAVKNISGSAGFDKTGISSVIDIILNKPTQMLQQVFSINQALPADIAFVQPPASLYNRLSDTAKTKISSLLNFNIDSLFLSNNTYYHLQVGKFISRIDTAVSYTYDADFNPVEKKVVNNILEPSFSFDIKGPDANSIYTYWQSNKNIEQTPEGTLFTSMPLVKSYCLLSDSSRLNIRSNNYNMPSKAELTDSCLLYTSVNILSMPDSLMKFLPANIVPLLRKIAGIVIYSKQPAAGKITIEATITKQKGEEWFD